MNGVSHTRAELAAAVDRAHELLHDAEAHLAGLRTRYLAGCGREHFEADFAQSLTAVQLAHQALHAAGGGLLRTGSATRDPEAQQIAADLMARLDGTGLPCGHRLADLIGGAGAVTKCGACLAARQGASHG